MAPDDSYVRLLLNHPPPQVDAMAKVESKTDKLKAFLEDAPPDVSQARIRHDKKVA